jgi:hypothetical protein
VLSRDPAAFLRRFPAYAGQPWLAWCAAIWTTCHHLSRATPTWCTQRPIRTTPAIHAGLARPTRARHAAGAGLCTRCGVQRLLYASSGAVYGPQGADVPALAKTARYAPLSNDASAVYAHGKRMAELLCAVYRQQYGLQPSSHATLQC